MSAAAGGRNLFALPVASAGLSRRRQGAGAALVLGGLPLLTATLVARRTGLAFATPVLLVLLLVVSAALLGGLRVALPAALAGGAVLNWFFTPPYGTFAVAKPEQLLVLAVYLTVAVAVSVVVDLAARRTTEAARARAEAQALASVAGATLAERETLPAVLERVRRVFGMREVSLLERTGAGWTPVETSDAGDPGPDETELRVPAGSALLLVVRGPALFAEDRRVLASFADAAATALEGRRLARRAADAAQFEAADKMRTALLAAVGHDLRTPLAGVKAAVSSLRQTDVQWTAQERDELLETIEDSADRLQALVANLLDASRLQAGVVSPTPAAVGLAEVVARATLGLPGRGRVHLDIPEDLPDAFTDAGLTERVVANILDNALRYSPAGLLVTVRCRAVGERVVCDIVDHGRGVPEGQWEQVFAPFQRLGDRGPGGVGLGLAVARGFAEALGGSLVPTHTPGGGLTMRLGLPLAPA